jgi:bifunctional DNA-binding transcriptional regulator/antitoxin component of YhaV-PrlF toxin-antitoxin module
MCDYATQQVLESIVNRRAQVVDDWRNKNDGSQPPTDALFTALDISREAQSQHNVKERHRFMKNDIHQLVVNHQAFTRVLIEIQGVTDKPGVEKPFLYYPTGVDPVDADRIYKSYSNPQQQIAQAGQVTISVVSTPQAQLPAPTPATPSDDNLSTDNRGRLWIPAPLLREMGVNPGSQVYITTENDPNATPAPMRLRVTRNLPPNAQQAAVYIVDRHNNIALSRSCFAEAGLNGNKYEVELVGTDGSKEIVIEAA